MRTACFALAAAMLLATASTASGAEVPVLFSYQGRLTDNTGVPLDGSYTMRFALYFDTGGTVNLWTETRPDVPVADGLFEVVLGSVTEFPDNIFSGPIRYLGITVVGYPEGRPLTPIVSVPYAYRSSLAWRAESVADDIIATAQVVDHSILGQDLASNGAAPGQVLKWDGSTWIPAQDLTGSSLWQNPAHILKPVDPADTLDVGPYVHLPSTWDALFFNGKLNVASNQTAVRIGQPSGGVRSPALSIFAESGWPIYAHVGDTFGVTWLGPNAAIVGSSPDMDGLAGAFFAKGQWPALLAQHWNGGVAFEAYSLNPWDSVCARFAGGRGISVQSSRIRNGYFEALYASTSPDVIVAVEYSGDSTLKADHIGVKSTARIADYWGVGGRFEGGYIGAQGIVNGGGSNTYQAVKGEAYSTGAGNCYGFHGYAISPGYNYGAYGYASGGYYACGIYGTANSASTNWAGYFVGDIEVTGNIWKSGALSRIDHPLDPDNKYLQHAQVESPEMLNVYSGNVITDASGYATVTLPDYCEAYNRDFRYQLTVIGDFAQAIIAEKISAGQFTIRTDKPGIEVSWQVTGVRNDLYAQAHPVDVEAAKSSEDRGKYVHPELFGRDAEWRVGPPPPDTAALAAKNRRIDETARTVAGKPPEPFPARTNNR